MGLSWLLSLAQGWSRFPVLLLQILPVGQEVQSAPPQIKCGRCSECSQLLLCVLLSLILSLSGTVILKVERDWVTWRAYKNIGSWASSPEFWVQRVSGCSHSKMVMAAFHGKAQEGSCLGGRSPEFLCVLHAHKDSRKDCRCHRPLLAVRGR